MVEVVLPECLLNGEFVVIQCLEDGSCHGNDVPHDGEMRTSNIARASKSLVSELLNDKQKVCDQVSEYLPSL